MDAAGADSRAAAAIERPAIAGADGFLGMHGRRQQQRH